MTYTEIVGLLNGSLGVVVMFGILLIRIMKLEHKFDMRFQDIEHAIKDIRNLLTDHGRRITNLENKSKEQP